MVPGISEFSVWSSITLGQQCESNRRVLTRDPVPLLPPLLVSSYPSVAVPQCGPKPLAHDGVVLVPVAVVVRVGAVCLGLQLLPVGEAG